MDWWLDEDRPYPGPRSHPVVIPETAVNDIYHTLGSPEIVLDFRATSADDMTYLKSLDVEAGDDIIIEKGDRPWNSSQSYMGRASDVKYAVEGTGMRITVNRIP